jgi:colicin import membrane protein
MESTNYTVNGIEFELCHAGTKGMKWGRRLYQNKDGSLTALGRMRYRKEQKAAQAKKAAALEKRKATIEAKKKAAAEAKAAEEKKAAEAKSKEEERQRILKTGSASEVLSIKDTMSKSEMDAAWARITWEQNMAGAAAKETAAAGKSKLDKTFDGIDSVTTKAQTLAKSWNMIANVYNAFSNNGVSLPKIDTNISNGNRETRKQEKKKQREDAEAAEKKQRQDEEAANKKRQQEQAAAQEAARKKTVDEEMAKYREYNDNLDKANSQDSGAYRSKKQTTEYTNPKKSYGLAVYNSPISSVSSKSASAGKAVVGDLLDRDGSVIIDSTGRNSSVNTGRSFLSGLLPPPKDD